MKTIMMDFRMAVVVKTFDCYNEQDENVFHVFILSTIEAAAFMKQKAHFYCGAERVM